MAKTAHYFTKFEKGHLYHIYNRSIDKQPLFRNEDNYSFFLKKYYKYLSMVTKTYAYCLLGNHFHILLRVNESFPSSFMEKSAHEIVSHQLQKFFQSYAMAFTKQQGRIGTLFQTPFKRALITDDSYFTQIIYYIHANPQYHDLTNDFKHWPWSSFKEVLLKENQFLEYDEVLKWFGGESFYLEYHDERKLTDTRLHLEDD
ncbi:MAG: transposase [Bacteroidetes bacterium]|nr:transposase [Bacteroidota bacterium]